MSAENKLIKKLSRREKAIQKRAKNYDRIDQRVKQMSKGRGVKALMRGEQRRLDSKLGQDTVARKPIPGVVDMSVNVDRFDYDPGVGTDFGIRLTFSSAAQKSWAAPRPGDVVKLRSGALARRELVVVADTDATHIRLEDVSSYVGPETGVIVNVYNSTEKKSVS